MRTGDEDDVYAYRSLPEVARYLPGEPHSEREAAEWVAGARTDGVLDDAHHWLALAIEESGRMIGDLLLRIDGVDGPDGHQAEIGWAMRPRSQGHGFATEAVRALIDAAFADLRLHRVWARLDPTNEPSVRLCERIGMRREARFVRASWHKGSWTDLAIYAVRADEWPTAQAPGTSPAPPVGPASVR